MNMLTGMGLALGIDYSLFVVSRYREERAKGRTEHDAIAAAGATASRAVLFSGTVFVVAMFGMLLVPNSIMRSLAVGAILVGIVSVVAALLCFRQCSGSSATGSTRSASRSSGSARSSRSNPEGRFWGAIVRRVYVAPGSASRSRRACSSRSPFRCSEWTSARAASQRSRSLRLEAGLHCARA